MMKRQVGLISQSNPDHKLLTRRKKEIRLIKQSHHIRCSLDLESREHLSVASFFFADDVCTDDLCTLALHSNPAGIKGTQYISRNNLPLLARHRWEVKARRAGNHKFNKVTSNQNPEADFRIWRSSFQPTSSVESGRAAFCLHKHFSNDDHGGFLKLWSFTFRFKVALIFFNFFWGGGGAKK